MNIITPHSRGSTHLVEFVLSIEVAERGDEPAQSADPSAVPVEFKTHQCKDANKWKMQRDAQCILNWPHP